MIRHQHGFLTVDLRLAGDMQASKTVCQFITMHEIGSPRLQATLQNPTGRQRADKARSGQMRSQQSMAQLSERCMRRIKPERAVLDFPGECLPLNGSGQPGRIEVRASKGVS